MKWNNEKNDHGKYAEKTSSANTKSAWKKAMDSVHNKLSRGAEYISKMIPFARKENWRGAQGHSAEKKHHGHHSSDKEHK